MASDATTTSSPVTDFMFHGLQTKDYFPIAVTSVGYFIFVAYIIYLRLGTNNKRENAGEGKSCAVVIENKKATQHNENIGTSSYVC